MTSLLTVLDFAVVLSVIWLLRRIMSRRATGPLPPGPKPLPLIGNVFDMPSHYPWETFWRWGQRWGGLVSIDMLVQRIIIINSYKVAIDLLEKRNSLYSDRPLLHSADMIGYNNTLPLISYGDRLREQRRILNQTMGSRAQVDKYGPLEERETLALLFEVLQDPDNFADHLKRFTGAIMLLLSYGYRVSKAGEDPMLSRAFQTVEQFSEASLPGAFLVDTIPALRYVPSWFPGAQWKHKIAKFKRDLYEIMDDTFAYTKREMANGTSISNFVSRNLERNSSLETEDIVKWTATVMLGGGIDTTLATLNAFFLAMTLYPEVQVKAQAEIDAVIGTDRLPTFQDRDRLPYVSAICLELLRWLPVGPLGVPHRLREDDEYDGYFLPKDSIFIPNIWGLLHDPETYTSPTEFIPERFLKGFDKGPEEDPHNIVFGFGRRSCPGVHVADATIYIVVTNVLSVFNISKRVENGVPVTPVAAQSNSSISHPLPFKCSVKPRSANAEALIRAANESHDPETVLM